jgi:flagellar hook-basal body complex protein FliE
MNPKMIPLTTTQEKIMEHFYKNPQLSGSRTQLYGWGLNFISDRRLQDNLEKLLEYGLLGSDIEKDSLNRDMVVYCLPSSSKISNQFKLPKFKDLFKDNLGSALTSVTSTSSTSSTMSTMSTTNIVTDVKDVTDIKNCGHSIDEAYKKLPIPKQVRK